MLQDVKITDAWVDNVDISGLVGRLVVNDVDVSAYVRTSSRSGSRTPEARATDGDGLRDACAMVEERAPPPRVRAGALPPRPSTSRWTTSSPTSRRCATSCSRPTAGSPGPCSAIRPYHSLGYPHDDAEGGRAEGLDVAATPSLDEVVAVREERRARLGDLVGDATPADLVRMVASPNGGMTSVMSCIHVVLGEEWAHDRYADRDLSILEQRRGLTTSSSCQAWPT